MAWRKAFSLDTLLAEVNAAYPGRDKRTDGAISGYPGSISSHNVNSQGVVCALDITTGNYPGGINSAQGQALAEQVRIAIRDQPRGIPAYPIHYMEPPYVPTPGPYIATVNGNWAWAPYGGSDIHKSHLHVSVDWDIYTGGAPSGQADYDTTLPWGITTLAGQGSGITPIQEDLVPNATDPVFKSKDGDTVSLQDILNSIDKKVSASGVAVGLLPSFVTDVRGDLANKGGQIGALTAAVQVLATSQGLDPAAVMKAVEKAAQDGVANALTSLTAKVEIKAAQQ